MSGKTITYKNYKNNKTHIEAADQKTLCGASLLIFRHMKIAKNYNEVNCQKCLFLSEKNKLLLKYL